MKTEDLIRTLAADSLRQPAPGMPLLLPMLVPALAVALVAVWLVLGFRPDLVASLAVPVSVFRIVLNGILGLVALRLALTLAGRGGGTLWPLAVLAGVAAGLWAWAFAQTPADARQMAIAGKTMVECLVSIPLLAILPVASVMVVLRRGATTEPARAGFVAGLAGGGLAAMLYALHCTEDGPLFYVTWYGAAILGVALVSARVGGADPAVVGRSSDITARAIVCGALLPRSALLADEQPDPSPRAAPRGASSQCARHDRGQHGG